MPFDTTSPRSPSPGPDPAPGVFRRVWLRLLRDPTAWRDLGQSVVWYFALVACGASAWTAGAVMLGAGLLGVMTQAVAGEMMRHRAAKPAMRSSGKLRP